MAKTKILCSEAKRIFVEEAKVTAGETGFVSLLEIFGAGNLREVLYRAEEKGFAFLSADESEQGIRLALSWQSSSGGEVFRGVTVAEAVFLNFAMRFKNAFDGNTVSHADVVMRKHYERKRKWRDKKNKILMFLFSLIPGAGQMYMGFMKQGLSLMTIFATLCAVGIWLDIKPRFSLHRSFCCTAFSMQPTRIRWTQKRLKIGGSLSLGR